jgi:hypothetical protein
MSLCKLTVYSHHFVVTEVSGSVRKACFFLKGKLLFWGPVKEAGRMVRKPLKDYCSITSDQQEFRFHLAVLPKFYEALRQHLVTPDQVEVVQATMFEPVRAEHVFHPQWKDLPEQEKPIAYATAENPPVKFVSMQTGKGKSYVSMRAGQAFGFRILTLVRAMYTKKWLEDFKRTEQFSEDEIIVITGSDKLLKVLKNAVAGKLKAKVIVMSMDTHAAWLRSYEGNRFLLREMGYPCDPVDLCRVLGVGYLIMDEVHQHFHRCYRAALFTHVSKSMALSATLFTRDKFLNDRYEEMYPPETRYNQEVLDKYATVIDVHFKYRQPDYIRLTEWGSTTFSNNAVEMSMLRHVPTLHRFFDLIVEMVESEFMRVERKKKKLLVLCYRVDLIVKLVEYLRYMYPGLHIEKYVSQDDWDNNLIMPDITVSTYGSSGTAIDVPELTNLILAQYIQDDKANVQILGRLRKIKADNGEDQRVVMQYIVADNIDKTVQIHKAKEALFKRRIKEQRTFWSRIMV